MGATFSKKLIDKVPSIKRKLTGTSFYSFLRDRLFLSEQKKEKRIERKCGEKGMVDYCKKWFKSSTGFELDLNNPTTICEKQQWIKFYDWSEEKVNLSDKYLVRKYIANIIGDKYLIPLITIDGKDNFEDANQIDFNKLPKKFVLSCNHGSSMTIVIHDKDKLSKSKIRSIKHRLNRWLRISIAYVNAFDFIYKGIKPRIIITEYLENKEGDLFDYKVMCFNGEPKYIWVDSSRFSNHHRTVYDLDFEKLPFKCNKYQSDDHEKPACLGELLSLAKILCKGFKFIRTDFYCINNRIYFGELTFNSGAGKELFYPLEYNKIIGEQLELGQPHKFLEGE